MTCAVRYIPSSRARTRGTTLVELLVALPIIAIVLALAMATLLAAHRNARDGDGRLTTSRELRHALAISAAELRPLRAADLVAWTDTSIEFRSLVGTGIACDTRALASPPASLDLLPESEPGPVRTAWLTPPQQGDDVTLWLAPSPPSTTPARFTTVLESVGSSGACTATPSRASASRAVHLILRDTLPSQAMEGAPVHVSRTARHSLYRAADGLHYLGRRTLGPTGWDVIQPIVGPLEPRSARGMVLTVLDSSATPLFAPSPSAALVRIELRSARIATGTGAPVAVDSARALIALRGRDHDE